MALALAALPSSRQLVRALGRNRALAAAAVLPLRVPHAAHQRAFFWSGSGGKRDDGAEGGAQPAGVDANGAPVAAARRGGGGSAPSQAGAGSAAGRGDEGEGARGANGGATGGSGSDEDDGSIKAVVPFHGSGSLRKDAPFWEPRMVGLPLSRRPLFPGQQQVVHVTHEAVVKEIEKMLMGNAPVFVAAFLHKGGEVARGDDAEAPLQLEDMSKTDPLEVLYQLGTRARVVQAMQIPFAVHGKNDMQQGMQMLLQGYDLIKLDKVLDKGPPLQVQVSKMRFTNKSGEDTVKAYINECMHTVREIMKINPHFREQASLAHFGPGLERGDPNAIVHFAISLTTASGADLMEVLEAEEAGEKLRLALTLLKKELDLSQLQQKISQQIEEKVSSQQREFLLREQMKMIKKELGEDKSDGTDKLIDKFRKRLEGKTVPKDAQEAINSELEKLANLAKESQEYQMTRNYLDWLTVLPWGHHSSDTLSLTKAKAILDRDHYGLNEVKERILEFIAVGRLRGSVQGKILCFVGPPGVGKTSIGRSIAEALGREFYRFSVGGLYDVAEIKGHRRTYVGAMPGKIIQCLKKVQTGNPLVLIDEVDKIGRGHQGDPASALLELLDPSQNGSFLDHYLDVPVDCSRILFVCTANVTDTIPGPLLDRMELIRLSGYDLQEKIKIAENYLVPHSMREVGLWPPEPERTPKSEATTAEGSESLSASSPATPPEPAVVGDVTSGGSSSSRSSASAEGESPAGDAKAAADAFADLPKASIDAGAIEALVRWYCREAGVRNLQKQIEKICRKLATKVVTEREAKKADAAEVPSDGEPAPAAADAQEALAELVVTEDKLKDFVGKPVFTSDRLYEGELPPGTVTGLAWTAMGGSVLYIEATAIPQVSGSKSTPSLHVTGQLGNVMKESSQIALLVARRMVASQMPEGRASFYDEHELHLHCPEGATPKDGPSAGVTMTTALLSLGLGRPVRNDLAMTGEISLNGKVLAVGGIKEKTIAARRAGCRALVYPQANRRDFEELPEYLREGLEVHFATEYRDVFRVAFPEAEASP